MNPSDRAIRLRCANTLRKIDGISGSYENETWKHYVHTLWSIAAYLLGDRVLDRMIVMGNDLIAGI